MKVTAVRSDCVYAKIVKAPSEQKNDIYRNELMTPFEKKWACYGIPVRAETPGGFDVLAAGPMYGHIAPMEVDESQLSNIERISSEELWSACGQAISKSLDCFTCYGIELPVQEYLFTVLLADRNNPSVKINGGYCGDGGIPGYILSWLVPNEYTLGNLPAALAHETNHNVRFQFIRWKNDITLGEMIVSEGLAENFAAQLCGADKAGPWVTKTDPETLDSLIKPIIRSNLTVQGMQKLNAYLYGDELAALQGCPPVGLPYCAGYACGYQLVKYYLDKTGKSIAEATLLPAEEILEAADDFWKV